MTALTVGVMTALVVVAFSVALDAGSARRPSVAVTASRRPRRRPPRGRRRVRALDDAYPDALDLFVVSVQAGRSAIEALSLIRPHVHPAIAAAIGDVERRLEQGRRTADALAALTDALGTRALTFVATIVHTERTGLAIGPMIDRIADDARSHRRRRAEIAARELPVRLAFPLVLCTLPSFVLVAIAPLLVGALSSLRGT